LALFLVVCSLSFGHLVVRALASHNLTSPPQSLGDQVDYDCIGVSLAKFGCFRPDYRDADFLRPFAEQGCGQDHSGLLAGRTMFGHHPSPRFSCYRPPLLPVLMALSNRLFGRQFWAVRVLNALFMSLAVALTSLAAYRLLSLWPAMICAVLMNLDERLVRFSTDILTESLCTLFVATILTLFVFRVGRNRARQMSALGVAMGLAILTRSLLVLWAPCLGILIVWLGRQRGDGMSTVLTDVSIFAITTLAVISPWVFRNLMILGPSLPLGSQGWIELPAAYSDRAVSQDGIWYNLHHRGFYEPIYRHSIRNGADYERAMALHGRAETLRWMRNHVATLPALFARRIWSELAPPSTSKAALLFLSLFGLLLILDQPIARVMIGLHLANFTAIGLTWSVGGRFLVPVLPVIFLGAVVGLWAMATACLRCRPVIQAAMGWDRSAAMDDPTRPPNRSA
jgi:4-amino-4-deoxy-L-arabinose transferase-like glycosyltransferase